MYLLNFSKQLLTETQLSEIQELIGKVKIQQIHITMQIRSDLPLEQQIVSYINYIGLSSYEWQTSFLIFILPEDSVVASVLLAAVHGLIGHFPTVIQIVQNVSPKAAYIINLQEVREVARRRR